MAKRKLSAYNVCMKETIRSLRKKSNLSRQDITNNFREAAKMCSKKTRNKKSK